MVGTMAGELEVGEDLESGEEVGLGGGQVGGDAPGRGDWRREDGVGDGGGIEVGKGQRGDVCADFGEDAGVAQAADAQGKRGAGVCHLRRMAVGDRELDRDFVGESDIGAGLAGGRFRQKVDEQRGDGKSGLVVPELCRNLLWRGGLEKGLAGASGLQSQRVDRHDSFLPLS